MFLASKAGLRECVANDVMSLMKHCVTRVWLCAASCIVLASKRAYNNRTVYAFSLVNFVYCVLAA